MLKDEPQIRLQKFMAEQGIASRRKCEEFIKQGLVKINGEIVQTMGVKINPLQDKVTIDKLKVNQVKAEYVYYALNKPLGCVSSAVKTKVEKFIVTDIVPKQPRVFPIGRLDKDTTGLIILTNDGQLTFNLTHPSQEHEKEYEVEVQPAISDGALDKLRKGVKILGQETMPTKIIRLANNKFKITLKEGKNRHIRRICRKVSCEVIKLHRIRIGNFLLQNIKIGEYKILNKQEVKALHENYNKI